MVVRIRIGHTEAQHYVADERRIGKCSAGTREILAWRRTRSRRCLWRVPRPPAGGSGVRLSAFVTVAASRVRARAVDPVYGHVDARAGPFLRGVEHVRRQPSHDSFLAVPRNLHALANIART